MSKYTTEVRFICENYAGYDESQDYPINTVIEKSREKVFDFDFPIYDESYRSVLETKILKHYYTREIGFETVALWKHWLDMRLNEIMPYYNQLYYSETLKFNPYYDVDFTTTGNRNGKYDETHGDEGTSKNVRTDNLKETTSGDSLRTDNLKEETTGDSLRTDNLSEATTDKNTRTDNLNETTSSTTDTTTSATRTDNLAHHDTTTNQNTHYDLYSDTPQGALTGVDSENYLTNARKITDNGTETNDGTNTGTVGNTGTQNVTGSGSTANTGTQVNDGSGSKQNTGTQDVSTTGSRDNTGTQDVKTSGEKDNTGTQTNEGNTTNNGTKNYTNTDDYLEHVAGKRSYATYSAMLKEFRETFLNIDTMIINELSDLFMNVW